MGVISLDYVIVIVYLIAVSLSGLWLQRNQTGMRNHIVGGKSFPWWAVCCSVAATETGALAMISIPGLAYVGNLNFLQLAFGYVLGRVIIGLLFLPNDNKIEPEMIEDYLGRRFGMRMNNFAITVIQITHLLVDALFLVATALLLSMVTGWTYPVSIVVIGILTIAHAFITRHPPAIWIDVINWAIYLGGAMFAFFYLLASVPEGWQSIVNAAQIQNKFQVFHLEMGNRLQDLFTGKYHFLISIIAGMLLSITFYGSDRSILQRLLSCKNLKISQKALIGSSVIVTFQVTLLLILGVMLHGFYQGQPIGPNRGFLNRSDLIFPQFMATALPVGASGMMIAGLLAATVVRLSSSLNSLSLFSMLHLSQLRVVLHHATQKERLLFRIFIIVWGTILIGAAIFFKDITIPMVELGLAIACFSSGGLLGVFIMGRWLKPVTENIALIAQWSSILFLTWITGFNGRIQYVMIGVNALMFIWIFNQLYNRKELVTMTILLVGLVPLIRYVTPLPCFWLWYIVIGCGITIFIGWLLSLKIKRRA